ncbi:MAG: lysine 2,3-aminomutase [Bradymonadia bacterium]|jgi:lysine 2,3-aminomutase
MNQVTDQNYTTSLISYDEMDTPAAIKPSVDPMTLRHRVLKSGEWWRKIPAWADVDEETFLDSKWQSKNSITNMKRLMKTIEGVASAEFVADVAEGLRRAPMAIRVSPYLISLIDWDNPVDDPLRRQFIPVASVLLPDHPKLGLDSLGEQADAPTPGLTHRYVDKALFLPLDTCPVYCRFCTRSYAIGLDTEEVEKVALRPSKDRWKAAFAYVSSRPELEDIVISGGDAYNLRPDWIREIGHTLLSMPNIRRIRWATKGPAIMPQKLITDDEWLDAITEVVDRGRAMSKEVVIHTHFNTVNEITEHSKRGMDRLMERGITIRNQAVLQRGVNDTVEKMTALVRGLSYINVQPYYVYMHDLVQGVEDLRTSLATGIHLEKHLRGATAGFNTPTFVCDAPGGGGKRAIHSYEHYDRETGVSVYTAPTVKGGYFYYVDPIDSLPEAGQARWADKSQHQAIMDEALVKAKANEAYLVP